MHLEPDTQDVNSPDEKSLATARADASPELLDLFWGLAVTDDSERVRSSAKLVHLLSEVSS